MQPQEFLSLLHHKIDTVSFKNIKEDIVRFIKVDSVLEIWSAAYFKELVEKIRFE